MLWPSRVSSVRVMSDSPLGGAVKSIYGCSEVTSCNHQTQELASYSGFAAQRLHRGGVCAALAFQPGQTPASQQVVSNDVASPVTEAALTRVMHDAVAGVTASRMTVTSASPPSTADR
jgi:hypothetical protein